MSTTKKLLITGGDSFTDPRGSFYIKNGIKYVWADYVAKTLDFDLINVSRCGMGNEYINGKVIDAIEENIDRDIVVMANWSAMNRTALWNYSFCDIRFSEKLKNNPMIDETDDEYNYYEELHYEATTTLRRLWWSYIADKNYPECSKEDFWSSVVNVNLRNIYLLDKYCRLNNIPILHHRALSIFSGVEWILKNELNFQLRNRIIFNSRKNQYYKKIQKFKNVVGDPDLLKHGTACFDMYEKYFISKEEKHPNEKGHQLIASSFVDKYIELYS